MSPNKVQFSPNQYWEERLRSHFGLQGVGYIDYGVNYNKWLYLVRGVAIKRIISDLNILIANKRILDVGSGTGFYIRLWKKLGATEISGSDITKVSVDTLTRDISYASFFQMDIGGDFKNFNELHKYDLISAFDILFHIIEDNRYEKAFNNINKMLKPGGIFIFSENLLESGTIHYEHQVTRSIQKISDILHDNGFEVLAKRPMFYIMNAPVKLGSDKYIKFWNYFMWPVQKSELLGFLWGLFLFLIEVLLIRTFKNGPSTEMIVCKKGYSK